MLTAELRIEFTPVPSEKEAAFRAAVKELARLIERSAIPAPDPALQTMNKEAVVFPRRAMSE